MQYNKYNYWTKALNNWLSNYKKIRLISDLILPFIRKTTLVAFFAFSEEFDPRSWPIYMFPATPLKKTTNKL